MFTGIIEETGTIKEISRGSKSAKLRIEASKVLEGTNLGDSISTNGICLTVVEMGQNTFSVDVIAETLRKTNLGKLSVGSRVNLERALKLSDRLGGHLVSGHIDGLGVISNIVIEDIARIISIKTNSDLLKYIIPKGSITIDGISLTVIYVDEQSFKVAIIPHTIAKTNMLSKKIGDTVNLETDMIAKYAEKLLINRSNEQNKNTEKTKLNMDFLNENGF